MSGWTYGSYILNPYFTLLQPGPRKSPETDGDPRRSRSDAPPERVSLEHSVC